MVKSLSRLLAAAPFAFGMFRAFQTGSDWRMLWMALAASAGAAAVAGVAAITNAVPAQSGRVPALSVAVFVIATSCAALTALLLGARAPFGVWAVAVVFGSCFAASHALRAR